MKKSLTSCLMITAIALAPALKADLSFEEMDNVPLEQSESEVALEEYDDEEAVGLATAPQDVPEDDSEGTPVGQAANEGTNTAKKKQWQNIAIATTAVALAVTALILVASNDGHHHHKSHDKGK